ncbi:unnamed protein product [Mytilus edulis]|uniref:Uncharacterized protein n=1 Tax=Mytilus edulis TaxID=6550 RepID=A0A8S3TS11_MYTED|nr:unnamed protein product [Mytilus edulis]
MSSKGECVKYKESSVLSTKNLEKFSWKKAYKELKQTCPLVTELMLLIAGNKSKQIPRIVSRIAILLFNRNSQMGAIQSINNILMFRDHIRTKVYTTFNRAGLCSSYKSSIRHVDQICQNFDQPVRNWANRVASHYTKKLKETAHLVRHKTEDTSNKMHNLVHALAVQDRVSADDLEECVTQADILTIPNEAFLPSKEDYTQLNQEYNILIQRVLVENIIELTKCKEFVIYHIPYQFSKESR